MRLDEIRYRVIRYASLLGMGLRFMLGFNPARNMGTVQKYHFCTAQQSCLPVLPYFPIKLEESSILREKQMRSHASATGKNTELEWLIDWHRESKSTPAWPRIFFARICQHNKVESSEIQVLWSQSRLQNLFDMALACQHISNPDNLR